MKTQTIEDHSNDGSAEYALARHLAAEDAGDAPDLESLLRRYPVLNSYFKDRENIPGLDGRFKTSGANRQERIPRIVRYFGDFHLIEELGRGGMGIVYRANQISLGRPVALKMIRSGRLADQEAIRRFRNEAEAIAGLDHPNLLKLHEAGEHAGHRYFTMPLVPGGSLAENINTYVNDPKLAARVMIEVANGIDHAHCRGILHRDLKPANILIDEAGRPCVADFGLAKLQGTGVGDTATGDIIGTPAYMAPEQAAGQRGAVTTATDIYGIGAILYALVTGRPPFTGDSPVEVLRRVLDEPPTSPRSISARIDRNLEAICLKCLAKEPSRRYSNALALANDLTRWLEGRPVIARRSGPLLRAWLWARRKPALASMAAALAISSSIGGSGILMNWADARHQEREATRQRGAAGAANQFLANILLRSSPMGVPTRDATVGQLLDRAVPEVATHFKGHPDREAVVRRVIADAYRASGRTEAALEQSTICLRIHHSLKPLDQSEYLAAQHSHGAILSDLGRDREAKDLVEQAVRGRTTLLGSSHEATLDSSILLASIDNSLGNSDRADYNINSSLDMAERFCGLRHRTTLDALRVRASILLSTGRLDEAERDFRRGYDAQVREHGLSSPEVFVAANDLAGSLIILRRLPEAEALLDPLCRPADTLLGLDHPLTLTILNNLAAALHGQGQLEPASHIYRRVVEAHHKSLLPDDPRLLQSELGLLACLVGLDQSSDVATLGREIILRISATPPTGGRDEATQLVTFAGILLDAGYYVEAELLSDRAQMSCERRKSNQFESDFIDLMATIRHVKGNAIIGQGPDRVSEVEELARLALAVRETRPTADPLALAKTQGLLGEALLVQSHYNEAEPFLQMSYETARSTLPPKHKTRLLAKSRYQRLLLATNRKEKSESID